MKKEIGCFAYFSELSTFIMLVLTLIIRKLQVMVHGCHEIIHEVATHIWHQVFFTLHLAFQSFNIGIYERKVRVRVAWVTHPKSVLSLFGPARKH